MTAPRVLLVGYYGKGNFGDDVLLSVTYGLVRQALPKAEISVIVDREQGAYVTRLLGEVTLLPPGRHGHFDAIIHGGGGVFFDFAAHGMGNRLKEKLWRLVGFRRMVSLENTARYALGKLRSSAEKRLGLGIGIGTYSAGSPRLRAALPILADFDALWLRDQTSIPNLGAIQSVLKAEPIVGSDLAFLTNYWAGKMQERPETVRPRLGIVLRDWTSEPGVIEAAALRDTLRELAEEYDITGFVFDRHADPEWQRLLAPYRSVIWQPETMDIVSFADQLALQDVLLTSRFHGALCGACLGVPSVIVAIEPKLEQAAAMLPDSSRVVSPKQPQSWATALAEARAIGKSTVAADVDRNRTSSQAAWQQVRGLLQ